MQAKLENCFCVCCICRKKNHPQRRIHTEGKQDYARLRDQEYLLNGRKSKNLKNSIKKLEEMLKHNRIVYCAWSDNISMKMLLSNGLLVHICIDSFSGDIVRMAFDKFLIGKLISEAVADVIITRMHILISYDVNQITFVYLQKPNLKKNVPKKIRQLDPKIYNIIISGSHTRKISRHLTCNNSCDLLAIWTKSSQNEVYPWRPTFRDQDRANMHIYSLGRNKLDLLCYYWTENDPINVEFSKMNQNQLRSVEQKISRKGEVTIEICVYEVNKSKIQRTSVTSIPLQSQVCCHSFSPDNEKLMLGCIDGSVVLFDEGRGITHLIKAAFIPTLVSWHADSAIVIIANEKSQIQCFDISLSSIRNHILNEDTTSVNVLELAHFFATQPSLFQIYCSKKPDLSQYNEKYIQNDSFVLLLFENGPLMILRLFGGNGHKGDVHNSGFTPDVLIHQYLKLNSVEKAINVLLCLNWDVYGAMLMISLHKIANYIFKQPFQPEREAQLQKALGSFLVPVKPLCTETNGEFGEQVKDITRKFFQYMLRHKSYEKAFTLAIDIDDEDLFMDLTNCAKEDGYLGLAHDAYQKAENILARSDSAQSSSSICSHDSCSECIINSSAEDSETEKSWYENNSKSKKHAPSKMFQFTSELQEKITDKKSKQSLDGGSASNSNEISDPRIVKDLRVSHYSKNLIEPRGNQRSSIEIRKNTDKLIKKAIKPRNSSDNNFSTNSLQDQAITETVTNNLDPNCQLSRPGDIPRLPLEVTQISRHHVVDVVPKPAKSQFYTNKHSDYSIPDQTIGIPITDLAPYRDTQNVIQPSIHRPPFKVGSNFANALHQHNTLHNKSWNIPTNIPHIIHHPLISGNIPPSFHIANDNHLVRKKITNEAMVANLPPKPASRQHVNISSSILSATAQQIPVIKKENGEKNKVKFSNTVTVAVVPENPRREKTLIDRTKRSISNGNQSTRFDPKRELQDSLPLCHPNDDYLKDFAPVKNETLETKPSNLKEGVLTWV